MPVFHVLSWMTGPLINIIASAQNALGSSSDEVTAGWCWIPHHGDQPNKQTEEILWMLFDGKFWEIIAMVVMLVLYVSMKSKIQREVCGAFL